MFIEHIAIWTNDLEKIKTFYIRYFGAKSNTKYHNPVKEFQSYFLSFESGARIELMQKPQIPERENPKTETLGITHFAFTLGSEQKVDELTELMRKEGVQIIGEPRRTGDGYYESVVLDPENNRIELVA
ncbi:VOC family protein [Flectobacillus roseus]